MKHILDNPAFNALATGNAKLANGTRHIKYFSPEVSPFIGFKELQPDSFQQLFDLLPFDGPIGYVTPVETAIPEMWKLLSPIKGRQMIYDGDIKAVNTSNLVRLSNEHIPQMIVLTKLTHPGPFDDRTIDFGNYYGIFDGDRLIAMAGHRMKPLPYVEISAVCTHPDYTGRGYAKQLVEFQINQILQAGNIPILHVADGNDRAYEVYKKIGFEVRSDMYFYILQKQRPA
ncbi:GNAT family N-acetyltransferase [Mucilaginibacter dorajii]|uniref:GNAT family N-acetyltransferase n=1 Tax=Mucilaginibacter dorajii TaxID=692994 RepID=A0ABP7R1J8_9SPHI|nr:GNAT family N-acetyltransferase [Mucilaginibacter dorajii]MCS3732208.1 GNAT superfamily N-acetyltransferase [Mucilaginibacter dorajii]